MVLVWMAATRELILNLHTQKLLNHNYIKPQLYNPISSHVSTCFVDTIHTLLIIPGIRILNNIRKFSHTKTRLISMIFKPIYVLDTITKRPKKHNYFEILEFDTHVKIYLQHHIFWC